MNQIDLCPEVKTKKVIRLMKDELDKVCWIKTKNVQLFNRGWLL